MQVNLYVFAEHLLYSAEHLLYAGESLCFFLSFSLLFNMCIVHSFLPNSCLNTTIVPLYKNKNGNLTTHQITDYALRFLWYMHTVIEFSINFKRGRGQIVFSISQTT